MTTRPIICSAPMVQALLAGRKTQTRRLAGPIWCLMDDGGHIPDGGGGQMDFVEAAWVPRVQRGDRLWVKEAHYVWSSGTRDGSGLRVSYRATTPDAPNTWTPSIHMPRWASRLTLTVTAAKIERLQAISHDDCMAEGCPATALPGGIGGLMVDMGGGRHVSPKVWFHELWESLHGKASWDANPEVVVIAFTVERRNIDT